jgi:DNA-binding HxlR family transcriptional regulator
VASVLGLIGAGAAGPILMALGHRPLRTQSLTKHIGNCAPRTVYRHVGRLAEQGLVVRRDEGSVPSIVTYRLSKSRGRELFRLLSRYTSRPLLHGGAPTDAEGWTVLALLGEMWGSGWIAALAEEARTPTELSELTPGMSFHQVNRRLQILRSRGLLAAASHSGRGRRYKLTPAARRAMALVAGIGRWRERQGLVEKQHGLTVPEMTALLRTVVPSIKMPQHAGRQIKLGIAGPTNRPEEKGSEILLVKCGRDGTLRFGAAGEGPPEAWAAGTIDIWLAALVDGNRGRMRVGGELKLVDDCLKKLGETLWSACHS